MNPLKMLLLVIVSTGLAYSAFAIERTRSSDATALAVERQVDSTAAAPVTELGAPAEASFRLASAAAVQYAAADVSRIGARPVAHTRAVTAPGAAGARAAPGSSRSPAAALPEPSEWMLLLCGLVVAGFIARRRTSLMEG